MIFQDFHCFWISTSFTVVLISMNSIGFSLDARMFHDFPGLFGPQGSPDPGTMSFWLLFQQQILRYPLTCYNRLKLCHRLRSLPVATRSPPAQIRAPGSAGNANGCVAMSASSHASMPGLVDSSEDDADLPSTRPSTTAPRTTTWTGRPPFTMPRSQN